MSHFLKIFTHSDQSSFVKGRYMDDNIRFLFNIVDYNEFKQHPAVDFFKHLIPKNGIFFSKF